MIKVDLLKFGGGKSGGGGGGGGGPGISRSVKKQEVEQEKKADISDYTDKYGNVSRILNGYRYSVQYPNGTVDRMSAKDTRDVLEGFEYDKNTGKFVDKNNRNRQYTVKAVTKKAAKISNTKSKSQTSSGKTRMMTALVRDQSGNLKTMKYDDYSSQKSFSSDLRGNGYRVLKIWNGDTKSSVIEDWEHYHRNPRTHSKSKSKKK